MENSKSNKGIQTYTKILETAAELFAKKGFDGITMRDIAQKANINESSIYNHFASKEDILNKIIENFTETAPLYILNEEELNRSLMIMKPDEILKFTIFNTWNKMSNYLINAFVVIQNEKYKNSKAALAYYNHLIYEQIDYYKTIFNKMKKLNLIRNVNVDLIASQYNYVFLQLTQEYFMARNGLGNENDVIKKVITNIEFYCDYMKEK